MHASPPHSQVSEAHAEMDALRRLVKLKTRELKNTRRLAQEVRGLLMQICAATARECPFVRPTRACETLAGPQASANVFFFMISPCARMHLYPGSYKGTIGRSGNRVLLLHHPLLWVQVLLQRSDVETFLLSSLHQVRKELERDSVREVIGQGARASRGRAEEERVLVRGRSMSEVCVCVSMRSELEYRR